MGCCMLEKAKKKVCTYKITTARSKVSLPSKEQIQNYLREESEVLRGILQDSEEIDENLTDDDDDDVVSDNESDE